MAFLFCANENGSYNLNMILNTIKNPFFLLFTFSSLNVALFYFSEYVASPYLIGSGNNTFIGLNYLTYLSFTFNYLFGVSLSGLLLILCLLKFMKALRLTRAILILSIYLFASCLIPSHGLFSDMIFNRSFLILPMFFCLFVIDYLNRFQVALFLYDQIRRVFFKFIYTSKNMLLTLREKRGFNTGAPSSKFSNDLNSAQPSPSIVFESVSTSDNLVAKKEKVLNTSSVNLNDKKFIPGILGKSNKSFKKKKNIQNYSEIVSEIRSTRSKSFLNEPSREYFEDITNRIEEKLGDFRIEGKIINILKGPVVDTFELELGAGVKVSKITSSAEDLSLALLGAPIRIVYPMKGRTTVGIEVPRNPRDIIFLDQLINTKTFKENNLKLPLAMGKNAFGDPLIVDLASMPHMLVAGSTGAGKSVFINSVLMSLLIKLDPSKLRLILIDPKQLELALYAKLPHLVMPVVTDARMASASLMWAVIEMERRYSIMKALGVRNLESYNERVENIDRDIKESIGKFFNDRNDFHLPYIVVIVDEFADLILTKSGKEIENNICRLAAKARACGIHLIIATQRPSVDVITGLIKANFPTRVSFRVTSSVDSRTILNSVGAERLLGKGDMLYKHGVETLRCHSSYVDEVEIEKLTNRLDALKEDFDPEILEFLENGGESSLGDSSIDGVSSIEGRGGSEDDLYSKAVQTVVESRAASASMLQRRLKIGYNRAANLIDQMESNGVVGPAQGSKPRKVLQD